MQQVRYPNSWAWSVRSHPTSAGASVTPGNNVYSAYVSVLSGASVINDVYMLEIYISGAGVSGLAKDCIVTIGFDAAGGTNFTDAITDLLGSCSMTTGGTLPGSTCYSFPLFVKSGTSIGAKVSVNNATVGNVTVGVGLFGQPTRSDLVRAGSFVRTLGSTPGSSSGTALVPGNALTKGTYVQLGSNTVDTLWYWQFGLGVNNATANNNLTAWDLAFGDGSNKYIAIPDLQAQPTTAEMLWTQQHECWWTVPSGVGVFARGASSGTALTGWSAAAYGVGG